MPTPNINIQTGNLEKTQPNNLSDGLQESHKEEVFDVLENLCPQCWVIWYNGNCVHCGYFEDGTENEDHHPPYWELVLSESTSEDNPFVRFYDNVEYSTTSISWIESLWQYKVAITIHDTKLFVYMKPNGKIANIQKIAWRWKPIYYNPNNTGNHDITDFKILAIEWVISYKTAENLKDFVQHIPLTRPLKIKSA